MQERYATRHNVEASNEVPLKQTQFSREVSGDISRTRCKVSGGIFINNS